MQLKAFALRDQKAEVFGTPFFLKTHGEAERTFRELVANDQTMPGKYPEDYDLYYLGEYNDQKGLISPVDTPQHLIKGVSVKPFLKPYTAQIDQINLSTPS